MKFRFTWSSRLHARDDFARVIRKGRRLEQSGIVLWFQADSRVPASRPRLGLAIPKAYGMAVERNRMKRLLREVFRLHQHTLRLPVDMVFSAKGRSQRPAYGDVESVVLSLWKRAGLIS